MGIIHTTTHHHFSCLAILNRKYSDRMKLSAILFVASATAQYDSNYGSDYNTDSNYAPQEYESYGAYEAPAYEAPADDERRGVQQPPSGARPGQKNYAGTGTGTGTGTGATGGGSTYGGATGGTGAVDNGPSGLTCWHCDAMSFEECEANGEERACHGHAESCFLEIRERRQPYGHIAQGFMQICMGCKQKEACDQMQAQNFQNSNPDYTQCRPETTYTDSVCRQCCAENNCTKDPSWWYPATREEWAYTDAAAASGTSGTSGAYAGGK